MYWVKESYKVLKKMFKFQKIMIMEKYLMQANYALAKTY